jgi:hypothetical protein
MLILFALEAGARDQPCARQHSVVEQTRPLTRRL